MNRIISLIVCASLLMAVVGCTASDEPTPTPAPDTSAEYRFSIYLNAGDSKSSRTPDGDYNAGDGYENYIDIEGNDFKVALYTADNSWLANVEHTTLIPLGNNFESAKRYLLQCDLDVETAERINSLKSVKLVVLANWRHSYPILNAESTLTTLFDNAATIDYSGTLPGPVLSKDDKIAMFGVCQYNGIELLPNIVSNLGTLHLLRSIAKIEVWDSEATLINMSEVRLTRHKTAAAPMPKGVTHQDHYVKNNYDNDYVLSPSFPTSWQPFDNESSQPVAITKGEDGHYIIYVPEFLNTNRADDTQKARLEIIYDGREPYYVEFRDNKGNPIDILRNYWYKFEVSKTIDNIAVTVQVVPYAEVSLKPNFGLEVDTDRYIPITIEEKDSDGNIIEKTIYYDPKTGLYYDSDRVTPIANPYPGLDPITGRGILTDADFNILYYYDYTAAKYYGPDNINEIVDPYNNESYNVATGITDVKTIDGHRYYYYRAYDCCFLAPTNINKKISAEILTINDVAQSGLLCFTDPANGRIYYYNIFTATYYSDRDMTQPISDPFSL